MARVAVGQALYAFLLAAAIVLPPAAGQATVALANDDAESAPPMKILFVASDRVPIGAPPAPLEVFSVNEDGSELRLVAGGDGRSYDWAVWAMNGHKIIYTVESRPSDEEDGIYMADVDGRNPMLLLPSRGRTIQPKVSPDGQSLIFAAAWDEFPIVALYRLDLATLLVENISARFSTEVGLDVDPRFSADGGDLAFIHGALEGGVISEAQVAIMRADGGQRRVLTADPYWHADPALSPDGRTVAFSSYRGSGEAPLPERTGLLTLVTGWHLVLLDLAGGAERLLTKGNTCLGQAPEPPCAPDQGAAWVPQWSPDGARIAYLAGRSLTINGIYVMDRDGANARPLIETDLKWINWFDWTPRDQSRPASAIERVGSARPDSVLLYGARVIQVPATEEEAETPSPPTASETQLFISTPDRWLSLPLPFPDHLRLDAARWNADRSAILLTARTGGAAPTPRGGPAPPGESSDPSARRVWASVRFPWGLPPGTVERAELAEHQVFLASADGADLRQLTTPWTEDAMDAIPDGEMRGNVEPDLSPDGRYAVFVSLSTVTPEAWILRLDLESGEVRNLTSASCGPVVCVDRSPRFSPDGEWISFTAEIEGVAQVFLMDTDGGSVRQLTGDSVGAFFPAWSPDGRWLAYARQRAPGLGNGEGPWELISLEVGSGRREVLLETDGAAILSPVWAPEGDRVAFIAAGPDASANIAVVNADGSDHRTLAATTTALELFLDWR